MVITKFLRNFNSNTTFTTPSSWQKKNHFLTPSTMPWSTWNERSSSYCYYVHYAMVMSKKYEVLFHHYTHYAVIHLKKTNFNSILETISILRSLLRWSWHIYIFTIFTTPKSWIIDNDLMIFAYTFTALWLWKKRLYSCCYYGHYAMIVPKKSIYILTLLSLSIYLVVAATFTTPWSWHKIKLTFIPTVFLLHNFWFKKCRIFALRTVSVDKSFTFRNFSGVLAFFLRTFSVLKRFVYDTVISPSEI